MWNNLVADKFDNIFHIFPISGHTMLPCDRDFGNIKKHISAVMFKPCIPEIIGQNK